jgi:hypothetical protein
LEDERKKLCLMVVIPAEKAVCLLLADRFCHPRKELAASTFPLEGELQPLMKHARGKATELAGANEEAFSFYLNNHASL